MEITTTYVTTPKLIVRGNRACHPVNTAAHWVLVVLGTTFGVVTADPLPVLVVIAYVAVTHLLLRAALRPHAVPGHTATITITDDLYEDACSVATLTKPWTSFRSVRRVREFWVLRMSWSSAEFLPVAALDEVQTARFEELLRRQGLLPPGDLAPA